MEEIYTIPLSEVMKECKMEALYLPDDAEKIMVCTPQGAQVSRQITRWVDA